MNEQTLQRLEYNRVKERIAEYAVTYLGKRHVETMEPMVTVRAVRSALEETDEALGLIRHGASVPMPSLEGMETIISLLGKGYVFTETDFGCVGTFLNSCAQLKRYMAGKRDAAPRVASYADSLYEITELKREIERCIRHGRVDDAASGELSKVRKKMAVVEERMKKRMDALLSKHRAILQENLVSLRGGRYVIPVRKEHRKLVQGAVLDESASGQTVYIEPAEVAALQYELNALRSDEAREETKVLAMLTGLLESYEHELQLNTEGIGRYDFLFAKAKYARAIGGRLVEVTDTGVIDVREAVHPLLDRGMVPLNFSIGRTYRTLIITGPNTGGKTVALKTVGLLTLLVQSGVPVQAAAGSVFSVFANIEVDIGDGQSLEQSLSTFSAHVKNLVGILRSAGRSTLVLIDEMASGTDPGEGVGLSIAVLEELYRKGATVVATTHFNEIKRFAAAAPGFENARMEFDTQTLTPLYRLRIGEAGHSYAFVIASKLGMPEAVLARSRELTAASVSDSGSVAMAEPKLPAFTPRLPEEGAEIGDASSASERRKRFAIGDSVFIPSLGRSGIVYAEQDAMGNLGVQVQKEKFTINHKRVRPFISKDDLYPEDYDFDIVFESKENRKIKKLMSKRHVEGLQIVRKPREE
jgi:DNA mismatch repair protein MutS2